MNSSNIATWLTRIAAVVGVILGGLPYSGLVKPGPKPAPGPGEPVISIPASIETLAGVPVTVQAETSCKSLKWMTPDSKLILVAESKLLNSHEAIVVSPDVGSYPLIAVGVHHGEPFVSNWMTVIVKPARPPPDPKPEPGPQPGPVPTPTVSAVRVVVIDDGTSRQQAVADLLGDVAFWQGLKTAGHDYKHYNVTNADAAKYSSLPKPSIAIEDLATGKILNSGDECKLPATKAAVKALIEKYTGRKLAIVEPSLEPVSEFLRLVPQVEPLPPPALADATRDEPHEPIPERPADFAFVSITVVTMANCPPCVACKREVDGKKIKVQNNLFEFTFTDVSPAWGTNLPRPLLYWDTPKGIRYSTGWEGFAKFHRTWQGTVESVSQKVASR